MNTGRTRFNKGHTVSEEVRKKISLALKGRIPKNTLIQIGEKHPNWKGDSVGYLGKHTWIYRQLGKPSKCEQCLTTNAKKYEWANKSGNYERNVDDYIRLCTSCHRKYDKTWLIRQRDTYGRFI